MPFRDATSGAETYGAGRYLEARTLGDDLVVLDFNSAYNPYCAYSAGWRCPLPPVENHLIVPMRVGEMRYWDAEPSATRRRTTSGIAARHRCPSRGEAPSSHDGLEEVTCEHSVPRSDSCLCGDPSRR